MDIVEVLKADYQRFPIDQTYDIYAEDVWFQDPLNRFRGIARYRQMIGFMQTWFKQVQMDLHSIERSHQTITTRWTLKWYTPLPWKPQIRIDGWSELTLNDAGLIVSHIDYWDCSRWHVVRQHFPGAAVTPAE